MNDPSQSMQPSLPVQVWGATDKGRRREGNEDAVYPESGAEFFHPSEEHLAAKGRLLVVADGMGGAQAGGEASRWAIRVAVERYYDAPASGVGANLKSAIEVANNSLYQYLRSTNVQEAGCTMTAVVIHNAALYVANVGDSRTYLLRSGQSTQLTRDHTVTQAKIDQGLIKPESAGLDPERNIVTRSLGTRPEVRADLFSPIPLALGDVVLLCSDGLTDMLSDAEILRLATGAAPARAAHRLIAAANERGGFDNISVVLAYIGGKSGAAKHKTGAQEARRGLSGKRLAVLGVLLVVLLLVIGGLGRIVVNNLPSPTPSVTPGHTAPAPTIGTTATLRATSTDAPQTSTPVPVGVATSTPLPTLTPTLTPRPATPDLGGTVSTETPGVSTLQLLSPDRGLSFKNPVHFSWQGPLRMGQQYQLVLRHEETRYEATYPVGDGVWLDIDLPAEKVGQWLWSVRIIEGDRVIVESEQWHFYLVPLDVSTAAPTPSPNAPGRPGSP